MNEWAQVTHTHTHTHTQNGSLLDGLLLWKSNLDKHFSGVEDCMICFSVIHGSNYTPSPKSSARSSTPHAWYVTVVWAVENALFGGCIVMLSSFKGVHSNPDCASRRVE